MKLEILAFGAHPDDVEAGAGGLLLKLRKLNHKTGAVDLTSSNPERLKEALQAKEILGLEVRDNLNIPGGGIAFAQENKVKVVDKIREYKPRVVLAPYWIDHHPDHVVTSRLVQDAVFWAKFARFKTTHEPYKPSSILFYILDCDTDPTFIVDISEVFAGKMRAIESYRSQFFRPRDVVGGFDGRKFLETQRIRWKYFGSKIFADYGEPYFISGPLTIRDPSYLF